MDIKDLITGIYTILFPAALKEIGTDFANATNGEIRSLWKIVKPIFIEEVEELAKSPDDGDAQAGVRNKLRKSIESDAELKMKLEDLLKKINSSNNSGSQISVVDSTNVLAGNSINVGGDFRVGDG